MNASSLAKNYSALTAEERFKLIVKANDRGDEAEADQLVNASKRFTFSRWDFVPYSQSFLDLALLSYIEMLHECGLFFIGCERLCDAETFASTEGDEKGEKSEWTTVDRFRDMYLVQGFILKTKAAGWKLFCERLGFRPFAVWEELPGFDWFQGSLRIVEGTDGRPGEAFSEDDMLGWIKRSIDRKGTLEVVEVKLLTAEAYAGDCEEAFRKRADFHGAE
jgi:hypothetical protein